MTWYLVISEHLVRMKLAEEVEEREQDAGMDVLSEEDHPSVVILNGLRLEDEQYAYLSLNLWTDTDGYLGGGLQRTSKHWGCIQRPSKWPPWLNVRTVCVVVLQIGSRFRNGICRRRASRDNRMPSLTQKASHPTNPRTYLYISHPLINSERLFSNPSSACMSYDCARGEPMTHCMKCANIFAFAPTFTSKKTNMRGASGTTPTPIRQLTNVKRRLTELPKNIVHLAMQCYRFQTR